MSGTTHLIQVRTKHDENSNDVAEDIANRLDSFVVEAKPIEQGDVATGPRVEATPIELEHVERIIIDNFKVTTD